MAEPGVNGGERAIVALLSATLVARPAVELKTRNGHRIITKIKHKDFIDLGTVSRPKGISNERS